MKQVKILIAVLFVLALGIFGIYTVRDRMFTDYSAPVISAESDSITASVHVTDQELLEGLTATDNLNGDVTSTLVVESLSKFIKPGVRNVNYAAFDNNNNVGTYTRELTYTDYTSPEFTLKEPLRFMQSEGSEEDQLYRIIGATDVLDGSISGQIVLSTGDRYTVNGETECLPITLQVSNRGGDTAYLEMEAYYLNYSAYIRQMPDLSDYIVYTNVGEPLDFQMYIQGIRTGSTTMGIWEAGFSPTEDVEIDAAEVDFNTPGTYKVYYTLSMATEKGGRQELGYAEQVVVVRGNDGEPE